MNLNTFESMFAIEEAVAVEFKELLINNLGIMTICAMLCL